jgi:hypothetical protein
VRSKDPGRRALCSNPKFISSTSVLNKDSLALQAINQEDEEATADMQDAEVAFYWDGGGYVKNGGAAWFESNRRAGVMFVILAVIGCGSAAVTQFQFYGDDLTDTPLMSYYHCNLPHDNSSIGLCAFIFLWMALLTLPLLAWRFLPVFKVPPETRLER